MNVCGPSTKGVWDIKRNPVKLSEKVKKESKRCVGCNRKKK